MNKEIEDAISKETLRIATQKALCAARRRAKIISDKYIKEMVESKRFETIVKRACWESFSSNFAENGIYEFVNGSWFDNKIKKAIKQFLQRM